MFNTKIRSKNSLANSLELYHCPGNHFQVIEFFPQLNNCTAIYSKGNHFTSGSSYSAKNIVSTLLNIHPHKCKETEWRKEGTKDPNGIYKWGIIKVSILTLKSRQ